MKCISECGFKQRPDNILIFRKHIEDCVLTGALSRYDVDPFFVWRNKEFTATFDIGEGEASMDIGYVRPEASRVKLEKKAAEKAQIIEKAIEDLETEDEIIEAVEKIEGEEKLAPKPKAPRKKKDPSTPAADK